MATRTKGRRLANCQEYDFGGGTANSLAVGVEGGLAVVSPPRRVASGVVDCASNPDAVRKLFR